MFLMAAYFKRSNLITKSMLAFATTPSFLNARLRFFDFLVRMWRLKDFWWVILPVPVTLNLFLALEFVLTFGILKCLFRYTLEAFSTGRNLGSLFRQIPVFLTGGAKIRLQTENGETRMESFVNHFKKERLPVGSPTPGFGPSYRMTVNRLFISIPAWPPLIMYSPAARLWTGILKLLVPLLMVTGILITTRPLLSYTRRLVLSDLSDPTISVTTSRAGTGYSET